MTKNAETQSLPTEIDSAQDGGNYSKLDFLHSLPLFSVMVIMIIWPWIFLAVTWGSDGLTLSRHVGTVVANSSQQVSFIVTSIAVIINLVIVDLFTMAVASLAKKQLIREDSTIPRITFFITLRHRSLPTYLFRERKLLLFWTVAFYIFTFAFITPGITALLLPIRFTRSVTLNGTELDFASRDSDCVDWFNSNRPQLSGSQSCDWLVSLYKITPKVPLSLIPVYSIDL